MPDPKRVVIIGGGAAGVFTAFLLRKQSPPDAFHITLLEAEEEIGGHAHSVEEQVGDETVNIDHGAQFFSETAQPEYCAMLRDEDLFDDHVIERDIGISIWHDTLVDLLFKIPHTLSGILVAALKAVTQWLCFVWTILMAKAIYDSGNWQMTFGQWIDSIDFWFASEQEGDEFKRDVIRPLMYQFGLVPPADLDSLSAKFVVYYFLGSLPGGLDLTPFTVYNSSIGLDGIHDKLMEEYPPDQLVTEAPVDTIERNGDGWKVVTENGDEFLADEVVFATHPPSTLEIVPDVSEHQPLRDVLGQMEFVDVLVRIQKTEDPEYMPDDDGDWSVSNVLVADPDPAPGPENYMLTVWFGPVREEDAGELFFKSWGSPGLHPPDAESHEDHTHNLMIGNPAFIQARQTLREDHQGVDHLWFTGGWIVDYDTQNSALRSAGIVVHQLMEACNVTPVVQPQYLRRRGEQAPGVGPEGYPVDLPLSPHFPWVDAVAQVTQLMTPRHPAVEQWVERLGPGPPPNPELPDPPEPGPPEPVR